MVVEATKPITLMKTERCWKHQDKQKTEDGSNLMQHFILHLWFGQLSRYKLISE